MDDNTRFEIIAHAFYKDTKFMAPGKSIPDCMYQDENARQAAWLKWLDQHGNIINNLISSLIYITGFDEMEDKIREARVAEEAAKQDRNRIGLIVRREVIAQYQAGWVDNHIASPRVEGTYNVKLKDEMGEGEVDAQWIGGEWHLAPALYPQANFATITYWRPIALEEPS